MTGFQRAGVGGMCAILTAFGGDCTFQADPQEFFSRQARVRNELYHRAAKLSGPRPRSASAAPPRRNFIDAEIFGKLEAAGVAPAALSTDEEFFRRIHLDLAGRTPSPGEIAAFLANPDRGEAIDRLLASPEFTDRWTLWLGDLLQVNTSSTTVNRQFSGRNAYHAWLRESVASNKPLRDIAWEAVAFGGNSFDAGRGMANFAVGAITPGGPAQDTYDAMLVRTATAFLGMAHYDCLLCHNGARHLDTISLWGGSARREDAWRMAAHFSRMRLSRSRAPQGDAAFGSYEVTDAARGAYQLNTNYGNRPNRRAIGEVAELEPAYHFTGATPAGGNWREAFADSLVKDRMFSRNLANRIWKHFFGLGLVDPVDTLDPARLDPRNPPPAPWTLQATHPVLLELLADEMERSWFNLRAFIRTIVGSSAYQLSSRYVGEWKYEYLPLFARHYPRRLEGEEIHDAVVRATGVGATYTVQGWPDPVNWALQLPEPAEPRSNGRAASFMNAFLRGNRDTQPRSQAGSILQQLALLNDPFVATRVRFSASPVLQEAGNLDDAGAVELLFLSFLSRRPDSSERDKALAQFRATSNRNSALEDLAWALVNKVEFVFSY